MLQNKFTCISLGIALSLVNVAPVSADATGTITLQGSVGGECHMTGAPAIGTAAQLGALDEDGSKQIEFGFSCNEPFAYNLSSQYGGLKRAADAEETVVYNLKITLPTNSGNNIADECTSAQIEVGKVTCEFSDSGEDTATDKTGTMDITWTKNTDLPIGSYTDSLTINIHPSI